MITMATSGWTWAAPCWPICSGSCSGAGGGRWQGGVAGVGVLLWSRAILCLYGAQSTQQSCCAPHPPVLPSQVKGQLACT